MFNKFKIVGVSAILCTLLYLFIGFMYSIWHPTWLIFLLIPLVAIAALGGLGMNLQTLIIICLIATVVVYVGLGLFADIWHPTWLIFLLNPIVAILAIPGKKKK